MTTLLENPYCSIASIDPCSEALQWENGISATQQASSYLPQLYFYLAFLDVRIKIT